MTDPIYTLPQSHIATHPPKIRGTSRLMVLNKSDQTITHHRYFNLPQFLNPGDLLILNDTKVIKARLEARTASGGRRELLLLEQHTNFDPHIANALYHGKLTPGMDLIVSGHAIKVLETNDGVATIKSEKDLYQLASESGQVPLPPYLNRQPTPEDTSRYQTTFARVSGSVAAPTASLNFTPQIKDSLAQKGVHIAYLTLHVGLGTFRPIKVVDPSLHQMHQEYFSIPNETISLIRQTKSSGQKVIALGTTVTRALEYSSSTILNKEIHTHPIKGEADIFIYPGYKFEIIDGLLTNFHAPDSTVIQLTAAIAGENFLRTAYQTAIDQNYKFLSYGDSMLIL